MVFKAAHFCKISKRVVNSTPVTYFLHNLLFSKRSLFLLNYIIIFLTKCWEKCLQFVCLWLSINKKNNFKNEVSNWIWNEPVQYQAFHLHVPLVPLFVNSVKFRPVEECRFKYLQTVFNSTKWTTRKTFADFV